MSHPAQTLRQFIQVVIIAALLLPPTALSQDLPSLIAAVTNAGNGAEPQSEDGVELSPISPVTSPLGESLAPLTETLDLTLDPITDTIDDQLGAQLVDALSPATEPLLDAAEPITNPVDGLTADLTSGSLEDALSNIDDNIADGDGLVNDLLGGDTADGVGSESGESSPVPMISTPTGESLSPLVDAADAALDPLTDAIDDQLGEPLLDALSPATEPLLSATEPVTDPVDGLIADLTNGSVEDALTNIDDNTADGNGLINDILGGSSGEEASEGDDTDTNHNGLLAQLDDEGLRSGRCADSDGDGVCDHRDRCPNTPKGAAVLNDGCHLSDITPLRLDGVFFEFDSATLTVNSIRVLQSAVTVIQRSDADLIEVAGHTDSMGSDEYNMQLSQRRAQSVLGYFIKQGIDASRLQARGYGETTPTDTNDTERGRSRNRRVELRVID